MVLTSSKNVIGAHSGGVIGRVDYADITNVHSEVNVTVKRVGGNWDNLGGLVGYANNSTTIRIAPTAGMSSVIAMREALRATFPATAPSSTAPTPVM